MRIACCEHLRKGEGRRGALKLGVGKEGGRAQSASYTQAIRGRRKAPHLDTTTGYNTLGEEVNLS